MDPSFCKLALSVIETEASAINALSQRIDTNFSEACELLLNCKGRIIVIGVGKSGHIANKIAATFASTGSPAFFIHAAEAAHGDFGMITPGDVVLAISKSGASTEILTLLPFIKRLNLPLIALTAEADSPLAIAADITLDISVKQEACPLGLAPTTSTTVTLVMGDAIAIALLSKKGFKSEDFALSHPGGALGKKLLLRVDDLYHSGDSLPIVKCETLIREALIEITQKKLGMTCVVDKYYTLKGIFTDGDVRRALTSDVNINETPIHQVMTKTCLTISPTLLAAEALNIMQEKAITSLVIVDGQNKPLGVIHMHDIIKAGIR